MDKMTISAVKSIIAPHQLVAIIDDTNSANNNFLFKGYFKNIPVELMELTIEEISMQIRLGDYLGIYINK